MKKQTITLTGPLQAFPKVELFNAICYISATATSKERQAKQALLREPIEVYMVAKTLNTFLNVPGDLLSRDEVLAYVNLDDVDCIILPAKKGEHTVYVSIMRIWEALGGPV